MQYAQQFRQLLHRKSCGLLPALLLALPLASFGCRTSRAGNRATAPEADAQLTKQFWRHLRQREEVIALVRAEKLVSTAGNLHLKRLPARYACLSDGGEILVEKPRANTMVLFFTFRGMLSGSNGFLYAADDRPVMVEEPRMRRVDRLAPHWFWVITEG